MLRLTGQQTLNVLYSTSHCYYCFGFSLFSAGSSFACCGERRIQFTLTLLVIYVAAPHSQKWAESGHTTEREKRNTKRKQKKKKKKAKAPNQSQAKTTTLPVGRAEAIKVASLSFSASSFSFKRVYSCTRREHTAELYFDRATPCNDLFWATNAIYRSKWGRERMKEERKKEREVKLCFMKHPL